MNRYEVFVKVVECGSFTRAADELGYTQSAVSQMVHTLEEELSAVLLRRDKGGAALSADGEQYLPYIRSICSAHRELRMKYDEMQGLMGGNIRIGTFTSVSRSWLPKLMNEFRKIYPFVHFELLQGDYRGIEEWISDGRVDFGFTCYNEVKGLTVIPLRKDEMLAALPPGHPLAQNVSVTLEELSKEPLILLDEGDFSVALDAFRRRGLTPDIHYKVTDDYTVISMVEQGLGVAILYELVLKNDSRRLSALHIAPPVERTTALAYRNKRTLPAAARRFIDFALEYFKTGNSGQDSGVVVQ